MVVQKVNEHHGRHYHLLLPTRTDVIETSLEARWLSKAASLSAVIPCLRTLHRNFRSKFQTLKVPQLEREALVLSFLPRLATH